MLIQERIGRDERAGAGEAAAAAAGRGGTSQRGLLLRERKARGCKIRAHGKTRGGLMKMCDIP